jgi:TRAP-type C4-dicarboxylate transport system permease small subunit
MSRVAAGLAAGVLAAMMLLTGVDVILRYVFDKPVPGSLELTEFMMVIVIAFGLAYCALQKRHVRIDLVVSRLPRRAQAVMNSIANLAFLGLFVVITWRSFFRMQSMYEGQLTSSVLFIPKFPFMILMIIGCGILCLVTLRDAIDCLYRAVKK